MEGSKRRRLDALQRMFKEPPRYRVFREPDGMTESGREAWRADVQAECERDGVEVAILVVYESTSEPASLHRETDDDLTPTTR